MEKIWLVPLGSQKFLGGRHIPSPGVTEPSASPFLMERLRPREVEQPAHSHSAGLVALGPLFHRAVLFPGFSSPIKVAGGLLAWWSLPQMGVLEAKQLLSPGPTGLPGPESVPSPAGPLGWQIPGDPGLPSKRGCSLFYSFLSCGSLSPHSLPDSLWALGRPCASKSERQEA